MSSTLNEQVAAARARFPSLRQIGPNDLQIKFAESPAIYSIHIGHKFPETPPAIKRGDQDFSTALIVNWRPVFTIIHVCESLQIAASISEPMKIQLNRQEVQAVLGKNPASLKHQSERRRVLNEAPCVSNAVSLTSTSVGETKRLRSEIDAMTVQAFESSEQFQQLFERFQRIQAENARKGLAGTAAGQAKDIKIQQLRQQADKIEEEIEELRSKSRDEMGIDTFMERFKELKVQQHRLRETAARLEVLKM